MKQPSWVTDRLAGMTDAQLADEATARADSRNWSMLAAVQAEQWKRRHTIQLTDEVWDCSPTSCAI